MRPNTVKALWREGQPAVVGWLSCADPYVVEVMAQAGFDALVLDMQHGMGIGPDRAAVVLQIISSTNTIPLVRVPWNDPVHIQYVLDAGAYGVIVPLIDSREEAVKAAGASRYAPLGYRSVGPNRARFYAGPDYIQHANEETICLVMIEHIDTIPRLEEIATAPGIDGFYIGPSDLAVSMGLGPGSVQSDPRHEAACLRVLEVAQAHGLIAGVHCGGHEEAKRRFDQGFKFCPVGSDIAFVGTGARSALQPFREVRTGPSGPYG
ncbi:MAG: 2,4-dihydroxyhept-2-ene-1,7-dioic acid aldolase [Chloroflexi bacterium]|nr:2,4-dihydroxyhept-2-ene-1,7-dioic acid aldolase [Chloroflexota bacterium]